SGTAGRTIGRTGRTWWIPTYETGEGRRHPRRPREHLPRAVRRGRQHERGRPRGARGDGRAWRRARARAAALLRPGRPDQSRGPLLPGASQERRVAGDGGGQRSLLVGSRREVLRVHA